MQSLTISDNQEFTTGDAVRVVATRRTGIVVRWCFRNDDENDVRKNYVVSHSFTGQQYEVYYAEDLVKIS